MKGWHKTAAIILCIGFGVWLSLAALRVAGMLQTMELMVYDYLLALRPDTHNATPVVLISETEADIKRFGYPLSDSVLATSLEKLLAVHTRVIGVDIYRDVPVPPDSERLQKILTTHDNIMWIFFVGDKKQGHIEPPAILKNTAKIGFNDMVNDPDGVSRRGLLFLDDNGVTHYAFPLLLALHYLAAEAITPQNDSQGYLQLGNTVFQPLQPTTGSYANIDTGGYQILFSYPHLHSRFMTFTVSDLIDGHIPEDALRNKVVLIGAMAPSLSDYKFLPDGSSHYGVELHAHIVDQLIQTALHDYPLQHDWSDKQEYSWLLLWCLLGSIASFYRGNVLRLSLLSISGLLVLFASAVWAFQYGLWLPLLSSVLAWLAALIVGVVWFSNLERNERRQLLQLFEQYVSPQVATTLWEKRDDFFIGGGVKPDQLTATVLFTDLVSFTTLAEGMKPLELMQWLNEYMDEMSNLIIAESGMINKYIGDAIMAVFGVPVKKTDAAGIAADAISAVESAVKMRERLLELNANWRQHSAPTVCMRVGIYTGTLVAGTLGGRQRMEYTVIGDTVNTASRLESFDKTVAIPTEQQPCRILVGEATWHLIRAHYVTEPVGECQLKGKHNTLTIYSVLDRIVTSSQ